MKYSLLAVLLIVAGCRKKDDPVTPVLNDTNSIKISIANVAGGELLSLKNKWYLNENKDSIKITFFAYYISNIKLLKENGDAFAESESYHLINESIDSSKTFTLQGLEDGTYNKISFLIGVDSLKNVSGAQTNALDPTNGMFWDWNSGYIMAKLEGESPQSPVGVMYHIGGFKGPNSCLRKVTLDLPPITITKGSVHTVHINADVLEWFKTPVTIKISDLAFFNSPGSNAALIADNYADMFNVEKID